MKIKFNLKEVTPNVWAAIFYNSYDLAMTFLRYQEFYESPNLKFKGNKFTIIDYMEWYAKSKTNKFPYFSYPKDFAGYNIPSKIIKKVWDKGIDDINKYDLSMKDLLKKIGENAYLIGYIHNSMSTLKHEIAHGLFFTNKQYKKEMLKAISNLKNKDIFLLEKCLKETGGYAASVYKDEIQAYMSTGLLPEMKTKTIEKESENFKQIFNKYYKEAIL